MQVLWTNSPLSAAEITEQLSALHDWHPKTVKTLIDRLIKKGVIDFERQGRAYLFRPTLKETECVLAESESFLKRIFGGSLNPMVAQMIENKKLSKEEIAELRELLDKQEK